MDDCINTFVHQTWSTDLETQVLPTSTDGQSCMRCKVKNHADIWVTGSDIEDVLDWAKECLCTCPDGQGGQALYTRDTFDLEFNFDPEEC